MNYLPVRCLMFLGMERGISILSETKFVRKGQCIFCCIRLQNILSDQKMRADIMISKPQPKTKFIENSQSYSNYMSSLTCIHIIGQGFSYTDISIIIQ
jgi:hypothetical protein